METGNTYLGLDGLAVNIGRHVELARLPGVLFEVKAIMRREDLQHGPRYLLELSNKTSGTTYLWDDDRDEVLHVLTPYEDA